MEQKIIDNIEFLKNNNIPFEQINFNALGGEIPQGIERSQICKTLILKTKERKIVVAVIPFGYRLNFYNLKLLVNTKKIRLVDNVEEVTGYPHGANGPIGISKDYPDYEIFIDTEFLIYKDVISNIGQYGNTVKTNLNDLAMLTNAIFSPISIPE